MEKFKQDTQSIIGYSLSPQQLIAFKRFEEELIEWNARFNLTAIRESEAIRTKHFLDSLTCLMVMEGRIPNRLIDIGTGAGFPGIPLKIIYPQIQVTLVESVGKKAQFCEHIVNVLGLDKVEVVQSRAEEMGQHSKYREKFDWAVARAVANMPTLIEYLLPLVKVGGAILAQKGESGPAEAHTSEHAARLLGGRLRVLKKIILPGVVEDRYLVVFDKIATTPPKYPRRTGLPTKTPLQ